HTLLLPFLFQPPPPPPALPSFPTRRSSDLPPTVRQALRRPSDPAGVTAPEKFAVQKCEELAVFLPPRIARYHPGDQPPGQLFALDRKSTRLNSSHLGISYAVFCLKKKKKKK